MKKINLLILFFSVLVIGWSTFQYNSLLVSNYGKFTAYPQGKTAKVDFKLSELSEEEFTEREQMDQVKDWLLLGVLFNSGLDASSVNKITFDMPTNRYGYMKNISNLEYGETRSKYIGNGEIVALIPPCSKEEYQDYMAHIADEHRKNLDEIPKRLYVFQYEIDLDNNFALITRQEDQDGRVLFTKDAGYIEKKIDSLESLNNFMSRVDDLTFARIDSDRKLVIGGRKIKSRSYGRITVEDIAAIWQAEHELEEKKNAFFDKWENKTYRFESEREALIQQMKNEYIELKLPDHIGFSLDPEYNYPAIARFIRKYHKFFDKTFSEYGADTTAILSGLEKNDEGPLFDALQKIDAKDEYLPSELSYIFFRLGNLKARYDGNLKGTEVGMHLFYTDLLAKLWALDIKYSTPFDKIPNFVSYPYVKVAAIYLKEQEKLSRARLWFGPDNSKFQFVGNKDKVLFTRNVSQLYAASSNPIYPGKEVPASAFWETAIVWWNNHFEEVAKYEIEYERLNEILKWSVVISWLNSEKKLTSLWFLEDIKVRRDNWFPDWASSKKDLKFNQWDSIKFSPKNFMWSEVEKMPVLLSPSYIMNDEFREFFGGVSLAQKTAIMELRPMVRTGDGLIRRSFIDYGSLPKQYGPNFLRSLRGSTYEINNLNNSLRVISKAEEGIALRNNFSEIINNPFERAIVQESNLMKMVTRQKGIDIGDLQMISSKNGFKIGFEAREIDAGQALARKLSDSPDVVTFLSRSNNVERFIALENPNQYLVKTTDSTKWMQIEVGARPAMTLEGPWQSRVSGNFNDSKICNLKWLDEGAAYKNLKSDYICINKDGGIREISAPNYRQLKIEPYKIRTGNDAIINARRNPITSEIYISKDEFLKHPEELINSIKPPIGGFSQKFISQMKQVSARIIDGANPIKLKEELLESLPGHVKHVDGLLSQNEFSRAIEKIDDLISLNGPKPELLLKKGIAQVEESLFQFTNRGYNKATHLLNDAVAGNPAIKNGTTFYDEINTILSKSASIPEKQGKILKDFIEFYSDPAVKVVPARINKIPGGLKLKAKDFIELNGNKRLIIQDNPALSNLDWTANIETSLPKILQSHPDAILIKIPVEDLGLYHLKLKNIAPAYSPFPIYEFEFAKSLIRTFPKDIHNYYGHGYDDETKKKRKQNVYVLYLSENQ